MKPSIHRVKVRRPARRHPAERRTPSDKTNRRSLTAQTMHTQKVPAIMETPSDRPLPDQPSPPEEGMAWEQRPVWSLEVGENLIRILPPYSAKGHLYEEIPHHWAVGRDKRGVICRRYIGKSCFLCEKIEQLWRSESAADRALAERMAVNRRYFYNVLNLNDLTQGMQVWGTSEAMTLQLLPWFDPRFPDATDPKHGRNITIVKTGEGQNSQYSMPKLASSPSPIPYDEWMAEIKHLDQYLKIPRLGIQRSIYFGA